jgi:hypothetical protein
MAHRPTKLVAALLVVLILGMAGMAVYVHRTGKLVDDLQAQAGIGDPVRFDAIYSLIMETSPKLNRHVAIIEARTLSKLPDNDLFFLVLSTLREESGFYPKLQKAGRSVSVVSSKGARGIAQFMPETAAPYLRLRGYRFESIEDIQKLLDDPVISIEICYEHVQDLTKVYGTHSGASLGYNRDTTYVNDVLTGAKELQARYVELYNAAVGAAIITKYGR